MGEKLLRFVRQRPPMLTAFGVIAATVMVVSYALESRGSNWIAVFAGGCAATALYGVLTGAWIFVVLESVWAVIALRRFQVARSSVDRAHQEAV